MRGLGERFKKMVSPGASPGSSGGGTVAHGLGVSSLGSIGGGGGGGGRPPSTPPAAAAAASASAAAASQAVIKLPIESAKKLRWFDNNDLAELATRHAEERQDVLAENRALKNILQQRAGIDDAALNKLLPDKKAEVIRRADDAVNRAMLIAARSEIERLRMEVKGSAGGTGGLQKQVDALEWTLGEKEEEVDALKEEVADLTRKLNNANAAGGTPSTPTPTRGGGMTLGASPAAPSAEKVEKTERDLRASKAENVRLKRELATARKEAKENREAAEAAALSAATSSSASTAPTPAVSTELVSNITALLNSFADAQDAATAATSRMRTEETQLAEAASATSRAAAGIVEATRDASTAAARCRAEAQQAQQAAAKAASARPTAASSTDSDAIALLSTERDRLSRELTACKRDLSVARVSLDEAQARLESQSRASKRMEESMRESQNRISELEAELDGTYEEHRSLVAAKSEAERSLDAANSELVSARAELEHAETRRVEKLKEIKGGVTALEKRAESAEASLEKERITLEEERQRVAKLERERDSLHKKVAPLEKALESEKARARDAIASLEEVRAERQRSVAELTSMRGELDAASASAERLNVTAAALASREAEVAELKRQLSTAEGAASSARRDSESMSEERLALQDALAAARAECARTAREAANLQAAAVEWEAKREAREHWPESAKGMVLELEEQLMSSRSKVDALEASTMAAQEREDRIAREAAEAGASVETLGERLRVAEKHWREEFEKKEAELSAANDEARTQRSRADELESSVDESAASRAEELATALSAVRAELEARTEELDRLRSRSRALLEEKETELAHARSLQNLQNLSGSSSDLAGTGTAAAAAAASVATPSTPSTPPPPGTAAAGVVDGSSPRTPAPATEGESGDDADSGLLLTAEKRRNEALLIALRDAERINELNEQAKEVLKTELNDVRRANVPRTRDGVDLLYLKNVVIKGYETGEVQRLLDVLSTLLQFTPDEDRRARKSFSRGVGSSASSSVLGLIPPGSPFAKLFGS